MRPAAGRRSPQTARPCSATGSCSDAAREVLDRPGPGPGRRRRRVGRHGRRRGHPARGRRRGRRLTWPTATAPPPAAPDARRPRRSSRTSSRARSAAPACSCWASCVVWLRALGRSSRARTPCALGLQDPTGFHDWLNDLRDWRPAARAATTGSSAACIGFIADALNASSQFLQSWSASPAFPRPVPADRLARRAGHLAWIAWAVAGRRSTVAGHVSACCSSAFFGLWEDSIDLLIVTDPRGAGLLRRSVCRSASRWPAARRSRRSSRRCST